MSAFLVFNIQFTASLIVFILIAAWYVSPALRKLPLRQALIPLLLVHVFRYTPLTLFAPGQVDSTLPTVVAETVAYGDLISAILAFVAVLMLRYKIPGDRITVWVFTIVGIADILVALYSGITHQVYQYELGLNWYIVTYYVPMLIVTHVMIIRHLLRNSST